MIKKYCFMMIMLVNSFNLFAQNFNIIPYPKSIEPVDASFEINKKTSFVMSKVDDNTKQIIKGFVNKIAKSTGIHIEVTPNKPKANYIVIDFNPIMGEEEYRLKVDAERITIESKGNHGLFYAMQTLQQLLPVSIESPILENVSNLKVPGVSIVDEPNFSYRGIMIDACRNFKSIDFIKRQLDILAMYKINRFHWHLTDDQGWRAEIKKYPLLTTVGGVRKNGDGITSSGFYTQDEMREVVRYAAERFITVVPEIELPGHATAALAAYPELSVLKKPIDVSYVWGNHIEVFDPSNEKTFEFFTDVFKEICDIFPSEYIHIGGDEVNKTRWINSENCKRLMSEKGMNTPLELHGYFVKRVESILSQFGRKVIGWDEILEGDVNQTTTVMSWRGEKGGIEAANLGHEVIMAPSNYIYLDRYQGDPTIEPMALHGYNTLQRVYEYNPIPKDVAEDKKHLIIGAQGNMWTEYAFTDEITEYRLYPRAIALAENLWTTPKNKSFDDFVRRLDRVHQVLDYRGVNYHIPLPEGPQHKKVVFVDDVTLTFTNTRKLKMLFTLDGTDPSAKSMVYKEPLKFSETKTLKIASMLPTGKMSPVRTIPIEKTKYALPFEGPVTPGIQMEKALGFFRDSTSYPKTGYTSKKIIPEFTPRKEFNWRMPSLEIYEGYFAVEEDGVYSVICDQELLYINGQLVIDNNGVIRRALRNRSQVALAKGLHKFKLCMNNNVIGGFPAVWSENTFYVNKVDDKGKPTAIASDKLFH